MARLHYASEKQGPGRRYWFRRASDAGAFADYKRRLGWVVVADGGLDVWVGRRGGRTPDIVAGIDPADL